MAQAVAIPMATRPVYDLGINDAKLLIVPSLKERAQRGGAYERIEAILDLCDRWATEQEAASIVFHDQNGEPIQYWIDRQLWVVTSAVEALLTWGDQRRKAVMIPFTPAQQRIYRSVIRQIMLRHDVTCWAPNVIYPNRYGQYGPEC